jgi:hypothetical protein
LYQPSFSIQFAVGADDATRSYGGVTPKNCHGDCQIANWNTGQRKGNVIEQHKAGNFVAGSHDWPLSDSNGLNGSDFAATRLSASRENRHPPEPLCHWGGNATGYSSMEAGLEAGFRAVLVEECQFFWSTTIGSPPFVW